jgi:hypothetical protein
VPLQFISNITIFSTWMHDWDLCLYFEDPWLESRLRHWLAWPVLHTLALVGRLVIYSLPESWQPCTIYTGVNWSSSSSSIYIATDSQSASSSLCRAPFRAGDQISQFFEIQLLSFFFHVGSPLWREDGSVICSAITQVQVQFILRPTVSRPVRLDVRPLVEHMTKF